MGFRRSKATVVNEPVTEHPGTDDPDFTLALEEARRNFDSLNGRLADLRNRSLQLVSVGALAASFVAVYQLCKTEVSVSGISQRSRRLR
jgi:hypothetical protein